MGPPGCAAGPIWGGSGRYVGHLGVIWGPQGVQETLSWADLGARGPYLGGSGRYVGHLGSFGTSRACRGPYLGRIWALGDPIWADLRAMWAIWGAFGAPRVCRGPYLGRIWALCGPFGVPRACRVPYLGWIWAPCGPSGHHVGHLVQNIEFYHV